ncbi:MAG: Xaa-Pro aminopeptidase [Thermoleophilaceae bacterium]|jgi:Xaa-Pro aminopeptidase|nr:Xaa-Pro aminopeptidase [Thermoleophilaceae bacterium]
MPVLIYGDTVRSPALRHEVPVSIIDPFLYLESNGTRAVTASALERPRLEEAGSFELIGLEELGWDELIASGRPRWDIEIEIAARAVERLGILEADVPAEFPVELADRLRGRGVEVRANHEEFARRRRSKNAAEIAGVRRAQAAADAAMGCAAELLRGGGSLTSELVRNEMIAVCREHGATMPADVIVASGAAGAIGHDSGSGPLREGEPIIIDIWPVDDESACYSDMTRTFFLGDVPDELAEWHRLTEEALEKTRAAVRPGVNGREIYDIACQVYEDAGIPTQRTKAEGEVLRDGFFHGLGHGVGLDVHEEPGLGRSGDDLVVGDVITLEPGTYRQGYGGVRLEDLVLVTEDGSETLTNFEYSLAP